MTGIFEPPTRLVLLGHPVSHSLSPTFQTAALRSAGLDVTYDALDVAPDSLGTVLRDLARAGVAGNVTIPHKETVAVACSNLTDVAKRVGAVNTFWHERGRLVGDNTDVEGARVAIRSVLQILGAPGTDTTADPSPMRITILGAGGAAAAVLVAAESFAPYSMTVWSRTLQRAHALINRVDVNASVADDVDHAVHDADLVINCTPVGLSGNEKPVSVESLKDSARVLDLIPRKGETEWLAACRKRGHVGEDGLRMLIEQGAASFERWFNIVPDRASMWRSLREPANSLSAARARPDSAS